jgi:conjugal transfer ATP-binding protein TraC
MTNANQLISGGSGSGKSFMTTLLLCQMLKENPKVYFVDIGGSYKKLCENLSGQYLPLGVGVGLSFNPFDLAEGETQPSPQKIKFLVGLIELMTKDDEAARLPKLERAEIEDAIARVYDQNRKPRLSHLKELLAAHSDVEIRKYGRILAPWCGETPFGQFVDRDTNIALNRPIVAFDLKGMESYPDLQAVCLYIITDFVWREVQRDRQTMKFLVFDECWKLLKNDAGLVFIEEVFRTFRKYFASAIAISQDIDDFAKSKIAGAILPNCAVKWVLMQQQSDPVRIKEALDLNDNELSLVKSLRQEKGVYSEAFLIAQKDRIVTVIESTPLEYWIATTDPKDLAKIEEAVKTNPASDPVSVLKTLAEKYPRGVAAAEKGVA